MNSLSSVEASLPPGFRFHPRDEELICDYLMKRVTPGHHTPFLIEVDLNKCEPWDIPETACVGGKDWYFYSQRDRKYATGIRTNRATFSGYWKATGKDRPVIHKENLVGMRKTLVFYQGRAPKGRKTDWVMHEFRLQGKFEPDLQSPSSIKEDWVLCRVFNKSTSDQNIPHKLQDIKISSYTTSSSSSPPPIISLPPLMEPYMSTFDQIQDNYYKYHQQQQVSCFSIFNSSNQTLPSFSLPTDQIPPHFFGGLYNYNSQLLNPNCDKNVIKAVLDHLTKLESCNDHSILGEAISDSTNLSDYGLSSMWEDCSYI